MFFHKVISDIHIKKSFILNYGYIFISRFTLIKKCCLHLRNMGTILIARCCFKKNIIDITFHANFMFCGTWVAREMLLNVHRHSLLSDGSWNMM